jgi:very-short-patch-repair endonuclease
MLQLITDVKRHQRIGNHSVDIFVPEWNLALEYQGEQHFHQTWRGDLKRYLFHHLSVD